MGSKRCLFLLENLRNRRGRGHLVNRIGGEKFFNSLWQLDLGENGKITKNDIFLQFGALFDSFLTILRTF